MRKTYSVNVALRNELKKAGIDGDALDRRIGKGRGYTTRICRGIQLCTKEDGKSIAKILKVYPSKLFREYKGIRRKPKVWVRGDFVGGYTKDNVGTHTNYKCNTCKQYPGVGGYIRGFIVGGDKYNQSFLAGLKAHLRTHKNHEIPKEEVVYPQPAPELDFPESTPLESGDCPKEEPRKTHLTGTDCSTISTIVRTEIQMALKNNKGFWAMLWQRIFG